MTERVEFDWEEAKKHHSPAMYAFLLATHDKPMTMDEFVELRAQVPRISRAGNVVTRNASRGRQQYRRLRERFGFFGGV